MIVSPSGEVMSWLLFPETRPLKPNEQWEVIPKEYWHLEKVLSGHDVALTTNTRKELYLLNNNSVMKWSSNSWHRVSGPPLSELLARYIPNGAAKRVAELVISLSALRTGALVCISNEPERLLANASKGIRSLFGKKRLVHIEEISTPSLVRLASIDGAVILDTDGVMRNAGVILNVPKEHTSAGEGARTAAASYASTEGLSIKVSHDGPISVYEHGKLVRKIA